MTRRIDRPEPGLYRTRLTKGGPWLPARIWRQVAVDPVTGERLDRSPVLLCLVAGEDRDPWLTWPGLHPVDEAEFKRLLGTMPDDPRQQLDLNASPSLF